MKYYRIQFTDIVGEYSLKWNIPGEDVTKPIYRRVTDYVEYDTNVNAAWIKHQIKGENIKVRAIEKSEMKPRTEEYFMLDVVVGKKETKQ